MSADTSEGQAARTSRPTVMGKVVSDKMTDTCVVEAKTKRKHPLYKKYVGQSTKYYVHDAGNTAHVGDDVEIVQTRPISKLKRWRLVRVTRRAAGSIDAAAAKPAAEQADA
ncbi:MAG: 30S ribosomal protein S17 [bacterium]|nr:30S ribosomal protein S17 [bacterium]